MERFKLVAGANLFIIKDNKVLLGRRKNTGFSDGNYCVVGGHLGAGETLTEAAAREGREEAGIEINPEGLQLVHVLHDNSSTPRIQFYFKVEKWQGEVNNTEPDKCDDLRWFPLNQLPENIVPSSRHAIQQFLAGNVYSEFGF